MISAQQPGAGATDSGGGGWFTGLLREFGCYPHEDTLVTPIIGHYVIPPTPPGPLICNGGPDWRSSWHYVASELAEWADEVFGWRVEHVIESQWAVRGSGFVVPIGPYAVELAASHPLGGLLVARFPSAHHPDPAARLWLTADRMWDLLDERAPRSIRNGRILSRAGLKKKA